MRIDVEAMTALELHGNKTKILKNLTYKELKDFW